MRTGGQIGGSHPISSVPDKVLRHWLHPVDRAEKRQRVGLYLANSRYWNDERRSFAAKVMKDAVRALEVGACRRPFALIVDTYEPHEPWTPPPQVRGHVRQVARPASRRCRATARSTTG